MRVSYLLWIYTSLLHVSSTNAQRVRRRENQQGSSLNSTSSVFASIDTQLPTSSPARDMQTVLDAIVIGAGWAGIGAARTLKKNGMGFVVLEARDYIGGRSRSVTMDSSMVELGSNWIHGASATNNPIYKLSKDFGAPSVVSDPDESVALYSNKYLSLTPHQVSDAEYTRIETSLLDNGFTPFMEKRQDSTDVDSSLRTTADLYISNKKLGTKDKLALEFLMDTTISHEYAASLQDMSTWWWDSDGEIAGGDVVLTNGYGDLVNKSAQDFTNSIYLQTKVTKIDWTNTIVTVTYIQNGVTKTVSARNVIVTVPLGVLQQKVITFVPALPSAKLTSISKLGMGVYNKAIYKWDSSTNLPWPGNVEWLEKIGTPQGRWTEFYNLQPINGKKILIAFSAGREAERAELLTDAQIQTEVFASLKEMFNVDIPAPTHSRVTRWKQDVFSYGSYSYYKLGSRPRDRENLRASLNGRVFFAGEACHMTYPSTTHGAYMTGIEMAGKITRRRRRQLRKLAAEASE